MSDSSVSQYKFNIPSDLKVRLQEAADRSGRSLSSEIITRLQASLALGDELGLEFTRESVEELIINIVQHETNPLSDRIHEVEQHLIALERNSR